MICPCGETLKKRKVDVGLEIECVSCGRYEVKALVENIDFNKFDYSLPERVFPPPSKPVEDIGNKLIRLTNLRKKKQRRLVLPQNRLVDKKVLTNWSVLDGNLVKK
jgi:hypothetical protein